MFHGCIMMVIFFWQQIFDFDFISWFDLSFNSQSLSELVYLLFFSWSINVIVFFTNFNIIKIFLNDWNWTRTHNHLVRKQTLNHLASLPKWLAVLWVLICMVHLTVCSYHVTTECSLYRVWIHSETRTGHDKNIESNARYK